MSAIAVLCIDGVEEVECLTVVDFCRRAGIDVTMASVTDDLRIHGMHGMDFYADVFFKDVDFDGLGGVVFPGGAGAGDLGNVPGTRDVARKFLEGGKMLAAICAAPGVLSADGLIKERRATGYPGCKPEGGAVWTENPAEVDGNLITGRGPGCAADFALEIIRFLEGDAKEEEIRNQTVMPR